MAADLVLGQASFTTSTPNAGGLGAASLKGPSSIASDGVSLWVYDASNRRVLGWSSLPTANKQAADRVVGKSSMTDTADGPTSTSIGLGGNGNGQVFLTAAHLIVSDSFNNRVLIWTLPINTDGAAASIVLGQSSFFASAVGDGAAQMNQPAGVWSDGVRLAVVDTGNNRVLLWTTFPTQSGESADLVLGWPNFGLGNGDSPAVPPTAASLNSPYQVVAHGTRLFVADSGNHRVVVWNEFPVLSGQAADYVIGQPDLTGGQPNANLGQVGASGFNFAGAVTVGLGSLLVTDNLNNRILAFTPLPIANDALATAVLGQPDLASSTSPAVPTATNLLIPVGIAVVGTKLFVADVEHSRVLRYQLDP